MRIWICRIVWFGGWILGLLLCPVITLTLFSLLCWMLALVLGPPGDSPKSIGTVFFAPLVAFSLITFFLVVGGVSSI